MASPLASLPLQLVCHLIVQGTNNTNFGNQSPPQIQSAIFPHEYVPLAGAKAALLASLPLQVVCQILVTNNPSVAENSDLVERKAATETRSVTIPEDYMSFARLGVAYKVLSDSRSWNEARKLCILEGGYLAIVDSWEKQKIIKVINGLNSSLYTGIHNMFNPGEWVRADNGLPVTSVPWAPGNPSGTGNCLALYRDGSGLGDTKCSYAFPFVCEIPIS